MEGSRTRDSHFIHHFSKNPHIEKLLIINRPLSYPELFLNKKKIKINGEQLLKEHEFTLYQIGNNKYLLDYLSKDILSPLLKKKKWFFDSFGNEAFFRFYQKCVTFLGMEDLVLFSNNIFSASFIEREDTKRCVFDAYDNILHFPGSKYMESELKNAYLSLAKNTAFWITNSTKNIQFYETHFKPKMDYLIKNGVDIDTFQAHYAVPEDLKAVPKPIIGFGGKITHLFDFDLYNHCVAQNPDKSFVIVGQILDKEVFSKIKEANNVYYLGDKHYTQYPSYVCNFDVGIIPYVTNHLESGVDSIKVYEYLAAGLSAVGTAGAGMTDLSDFLYIAKNENEFSQFINESLDNPQKKALPYEHTWSYKANYLLDLIREHVVFS
jgi:teichuronic acid biosynthesis glycosyltransferase TuaH